MLPLSARRPRPPRCPAAAGHAHLGGIAREELLLLRPGGLGSCCHHGEKRKRYRFLALASNREEDQTAGL